MSATMLRAAALVLLTGLSLAGCAARERAGESRLPFLTDRDRTPEWEEPAPVSEKARGFAFADQSGRVVTEADLAGRIHVASFLFTRCGGVCPTLVGNLRAVQQRYRDDADVVLVSFSVMPRVDTVDVLHQFAEREGIDGRRWYLLTGDRDEIYRVARATYQADSGADYERGPDDFLHTETVLLVDRRGRVRGAYNGTLPLDVERLAEDIEILKRSG